MKNTLILPLHAQNISDKIGNKAENIRKLLAIRKIKVPNTWVIPWDAFERYKNYENAVLDDIESEIIHHLDLSKKYAIRSSSNFEDDSFYSFAGLFKTLLNIAGSKNLLDAICDVWEASQADSVKSYLNRFDLSTDMLEMAVIVQEMVEPVFSGVLFSCNPMTGLSEIVIEGVAGEGTALVQDGVTPERWVSRKGSWIAKPENSRMSEGIAKKILDGSQKIIKKVEKPIDLEWVYDGNEVYWVQMREITAIKNLQIYTNRFSKDMMPGMIHPLIWSINIPLINTVWLGLLEEIVGNLTIKAEDLAKSFYYRSYFNMGAIGEVFTRVGFPSEGLEMMMGLVAKQEGRPVFKPTLSMILILPKLFRFMVDKWNFEKRIDLEFYSFENQLSRFTAYPDQDLSNDQLVESIQQLYILVQKIVYFNILTPILTSMYMRLLENQLRKLNIDMLQFDVLEDMTELDFYNPNVLLKDLNLKYGTRIEEVLSNSFNKNGIDTQLGSSQFEEDFELLVNQFGHLSDNSNNFMAIPWRENSNLIINMIRDYKQIDNQKNKRIGIADLKIRGLRKKLIFFLYRRARRFTFLREKVSRAYVYGYGLFRPYFLRLGERMSSNGWIPAKEDIFYLSWEEIQEAIINKGPNSSLQKEISQRKEEMERYNGVVLPDVIYGDNPPPLLDGSKSRIFGTPTSQGYYCGHVKVIKGLQDFGKVTAGDVIVVPFSDVGWMPLFSLAGAVIAESGGLLSHSSIIAREYQIPAVVSVTNCMRLKDDQYVSVNGYSGEIAILEENQI